MSGDLIDKEEHEKRMNLARQKVAKVCSEIDSELAEAFANILVIEMYEPHLVCATIKELIREITVRIDDLDYKKDSVKVKENK